MLLTIISKLRRKERIDVFGLNTSYKNIMSKNGLEKIVESGRMPVLFVGSGISKRYLYRYPTWDQLLINSFKYIDSDAYLYQKYSDELKRKDLSPFEINAQLGTYAEADFNAAFFDKKIKIRGCGNRRNPGWVSRGVSPYKMYLAQTFKNMRLYRNETLALELDKFRGLKNKVAAVITTNYDQFLEKEVFSSDYSVFVKQSELFSSDSYNIAEIYKIHGSVTDADSIVITKRDYDNFEASRKLIIAKMLTLFSESPLIFMGYSFTDEDVQKIITDFIGCLNEEQIASIDEHFVFISYEKGQNDLIETKTNIITGNGTYIPLTEIRTDNFSLVFDTLNKIVPGLSPLRIRQTRKIVKKIVDQSIASSSAESIIVGLDKLDNIDLSGKPLAIAVGYKENILNKYGYGLLSDASIIEDILYDNKNFNAEEMCLERFRSIARTRVLPVFKYVKSYIESGGSIDPDSKLGIYIERHNAIDKIITSNIVKSLNGVPSISSVEDLISEMEKVDSINKKAGLLLKNISSFKLPDIRELLKSIYSLNQDEAMRSTHFKRCVMYLDLNENR